MLLKLSEYDLESSPFNGNYLHGIVRDCFAYVYGALLRTSSCGRQPLRQPQKTFHYVRGEGDDTKATTRDRFNEWTR